jgi:hypothetical protein
MSAMLSILLFVVALVAAFCTAVEALRIKLGARRVAEREIPVAEAAYRAYTLAGATVRQAAVQQPWLRAMCRWAWGFVPRPRPYVGRTLTPAGVITTGILLAVIFFSLSMATGFPLTSHIIMAAAPIAAVKTVASDGSEHPGDVFRKEALAGELDDLIENTNGQIARRDNWLLVTGRKSIIAFDLDLKEDIQVYPRGRKGERAQAVVGGATRVIELKGQTQRVKALFGTVADVVSRGEGASAMYAAVTSILEWKTSTVQMEVWGYHKVDLKRGGFIKALRNKEGHKFELQGAIEGLRRSCALTEVDHMVVKVFDKKKAAKTRKYNAAKAAKELDFAVDAGDPSWMGDVAGMALKADEAWIANVESTIVPHYTKQGYRLLGGMPDSGLLVFVRGITIPRRAELAVRHARNLLRGGTKLVGETLRAQLVDFSQEKAERDGLFLVADRKVMTGMLQATGLTTGATLQMTVLEDGVTSMKGLAIASTVDHEESLALLNFHQAEAEARGQEVPTAVVDAGEYRKIYGHGRVGDLLSTPASTISVMEVDDSTRWGSLHLSAQVVRRAPALLLAWCEEIMTESVSAMKAAVEAEDKRELFPYLFGFGGYARVIKAGLRPALKADITRDGNKVINHGDVEDLNWKNNFFQYVGKAFRKGLRVPGAYVRLVYDSSLSWDAETGVADLSVPQGLGLEAGQLVVVGSYPLLSALVTGEDGVERSAGIGVFRIARVHKHASSNFIGMNPTPAKTMLRDEDGDKLPIWSKLVQAGTELAKMGLADIDLSVKKGVDREKDTLFNADITGDANVAAARVLAVLVAQTSEVGIVDNMITSATLYLGTAVREMVGPTGESVLVFFAKCEQYQVEGMKHLVDERYSRKALESFLKEVLPAELFNEYGNLIPHRELLVQKPKDEEGDRVREPEIMHHLAALDTLVESGDEVSAHTMLALELTDIVNAWDGTKGFVSSDHYHKAAVRAYDMVQDWVASSETRVELGDLWGAIRTQAKALREQDGTSNGFSIEKSYLAATAARLAVELRPAELITLELMSFMATEHGMHTPLHFCRASTLSAFGRWADGEVEDLFVELGLDRRNAIKAEKSFTKAETKARVDRGFTSLRVYGPTAKDLVAGPATIDFDAKGRRVILQGDTWSVISTKEVTNGDVQITDVSITEKGVYLMVRS